MCNWLYTVTMIENSFTGGAGCGTNFKRGSCDNKCQTLCGLIKINGALKLRWWAGGGRPSFPGPTLATAVIELKAIDRSKDLNVCTIQYVDNCLSLSR